LWQSGDLAGGVNFESDGRCQFRAVGRFECQHSQGAPGNFGVALIEPSGGELVESVEAGRREEVSADDVLECDDALGALESNGVPQHGVGSLLVESLVAACAGGVVRANQFERDSACALELSVVEQKRVGWAVEDDLQQCESGAGVVSVELDTSRSEQDAMGSVIGQRIKCSTAGGCDPG
jgi:hypothetical protein